MKPSVLIVDDEKIICNGIERVLSRDYTTYQAYNGREAIDIIVNNGNIDIMLCDLKMPVMEGTDVIQKIRSLKNNIYIILITAAPPEKVCEAMKMGANFFLSKPFDIDQLETIIRNTPQIRNKYNWKYCL